MTYLCANKYQSTMLQLTEINRLVADYIASLQITGDPEGLYEPIRYSLDGGGKRLRPALTLASCNVFSDNAAGALPAAAAVEVFHNFTLLHDDIMDNGLVRRGKPTVFDRWGGNTAILSGDAMLICSYKLLQQTPAELMPSVLSCFNHMALTVCEGQQLDMEFESRPTVSKDQYMAMIDKKTAALFSGASLLGAIMGGADNQSLRRLYIFATELGLVFQLQDDLLDSYGTEAELGKKIGGDIAEGKKTFLTITATGRADESTRRHLEQLLATDTAQPDDKFEQVLAIYDKLKVKEIAESQITEHFDRAIEMLDSLEQPEQRKEPLREIAMSLVNRNR